MPVHSHVRSLAIFTQDACSVLLSSFDGRNDGIDLRLFRACGEHLSQSQTVPRCYPRKAGVSVSLPPHPERCTPEVGIEFPYFRERTTPLVRMLDDARVSHGRIGS
jgi:hypothetical protein